MDVTSLYLVYTSAAALGLLHGSDPGHGWPLSIAYSLGGERFYRRALAYTTILAVGHFVSTLFVVSLVWLLGQVVSAYLAYLQVAAGALLLAMGCWELARNLRARSHGREGGPKPGSAWELFKYALLLGFAHEEEVALAAIVLLGVNPLLLAAVYSLSVYASMAWWTLAGVYLLGRKRRVAEAFQRRLHIISPLILVIIGAYILLSLILVT